MDNTTYKCALCGKEFDSISDRNKCEAECLKIADSALKAERLAKYEEERKQLRDKVDKLRLKANAAVREYEEAKLTYNKKYSGKSAVYSAELPAWIWW